MKKCNRRSFLGKNWAGLPQELVSAPYLRANTFASPLSETPSTDPATHSGNSTECRCHSFGGTPVRRDERPWTCALQSNIRLDDALLFEPTRKLRLQTGPSDTLDDFPGLGGAYLRIPWAFVEPEEGHFIWGNHSTRPHNDGSTKGMQVSFRISTALESWMYKATPQWVFDAGAKRIRCRGLGLNPITTIPFSWKKSKTSCVQ